MYMITPIVTNELLFIFHFVLFFFLDEGKLLKLLLNEVNINFIQYLPSVLMLQNLMIQRYEKHHLTFSCGFYEVSDYRNVGTLFTMPV